jgi:hypothetical protein
VQVCLIYAFAVAVLSWLALLARSSASKDAEILCGVPIHSRRL